MAKPPHLITRVTQTRFWLTLSGLAFLCLPSHALHYGLFDSTAAELFAAMGWATPNISWLWFGGLSLFLGLKSAKNRFFFALGWSLFILLSAYFAAFPLGISLLFLFISLWMLATNAFVQWRQADRFFTALLIGVLFVLMLFILYPLAKLFAEAYQEPQDLGQSLIWQGNYLATVIGNSLKVAVSVGILSTFFGLCFALYTTRIARRTRLIGKLFSILPMVTPPFVVGLGVVLMLGRSGYLTQALLEPLGIARDWLYGFAGIVLAQTLALTPMAFMLLESALRAMNQQLEEASLLLGVSRWKTFCHLLLPLLKPALANAFLIVFLQSFADFGTPFVLGGNYDVLASQIYVYLVGTQVDYLSASTLGAILLLFSLAVFLLQYAWLGRKNYATLAGKGNYARVQPLAKGLALAIAVLIWLWVLFNGLLYGSIFYGSFTLNWGVDHRLTLENYRQLFGAGLSAGAFPSLIQTLLYALFAAPFSALLGLALAYLTTQRQFRGRKSLEFLALLCFAVPGTVAGLAYLLAFNQAPLYLTGTGVIIVLSMVTRNMPIGMRSAIASLAQIDRTLEEAAFSLKASRWQSLRYVLFPLLKSAFLSALVTSFVRSMTTLSAIIFLVTPATRVATSYILNRVEDGDYGLAVAYGSTLIGVMMAVIVGFNALVGRTTEKEAR